MENRTIEFKGYTLTVYENGDVYRHARTITTKNGQIKPIKGKIMTSSDNGNGYLKLGFKINRRAENEYVHKIVALAFHENPLNLPCVNHKDGNKRNNTAYNLEWCTYSENTKHAIDTGLNKSRGEDSHMSKLKEEDVMFIFNSPLNGVILGKMFNTTHKNISNIKRGVSWTHLTKKVYVRKNKIKT